MLASKATRSISQGELVIEYVGEVIDEGTWEERKRSLSRYQHMYFMALNPYEIVDASRKGNVARFINHSCSPNLQVEKWYVQRVPRLGLFAHGDRRGGGALVQLLGQVVRQPRLGAALPLQGAKLHGLLGAAAAGRGRGQPRREVSARVVFVLVLGVQAPHQRLFESEHNSVMESASSHVYTTCVRAAMWEKSGPNGES